MFAKQKKTLPLHKVQMSDFPSKSCRCAVYYLLPVIVPKGTKKPKEFEAVYITQSQKAHMYGLSIAQLSTAASGSFAGVMADNTLQNMLCMQTAVATVVWLKLAVSGVVFDQETGKTEVIRCTGIF